MFKHRRKKETGAYRDTRYDLRDLSIGFIGAATYTLVVVGLLLDAINPLRRWPTSPFLMNTVSVLIGLTLGAASTIVAARLTRLWWVRRHSSFGAVWVGVFAGTALLLGLPPFVHCQDGGAAAWAGLADVIGLFAVSFTNHWSGGRCSAPIPLGVELARVFAAATTLSAVIFSVSRFSQAALVRARLKRASSVTVLVGVEEDSVYYLSQVASEIYREDGSAKVAVLTSAPERACIQELTTVGVLVVRTAIDSESAIRREVGGWNITQAYFVSPDASTNKSRSEIFSRLPLIESKSVTAVGPAGKATAIDRAHRPERRSNRSRVPLRFVVRIDDSVDAERWRREYLGSQGIAVDVVGLYDATAEMLLRPLCDPAGVAANSLPELDRSQDNAPLLPFRSVAICGTSPFALAALSWLSQAWSEAEFLRPSRRGDSPLNKLSVVVIGADSDDYVSAHLLRNRHRDGCGLEINSVTAEPTLKEIRRVLVDSQGRRERADIIIVTDGCGQRSDLLGSCLADEFLDAQVFQYSQHTTRPRTFSPRVRFHRFGFFLGVPEGYPPQSVEHWYRMGQLLHASYLKSETIRIKRALVNPDLRRPSQYRWDDLSPLYRRDNIRAVLTCFDAARKLGRTWSTRQPGTGLRTVWFPSWNPEKVGDDLAQFFDRYGFSVAEVEKLAELEAESWCQLRRDSSPPWSAPVSKSLSTQFNGLHGDDLMDAKQAHIAALELQHQHPALLPWPQLSRENQLKTIFTVMQTIVQLDQLGYYSSRDDS